MLVQLLEAYTWASCKVKLGPNVASFVNNAICARTLGGRSDVKYIISQLTSFAK